MKELTGFLKDHYCLTVAGLEPVSRGKTTEKYRIRTDSGTYILRIRSRGFREDDIEADHRFMNHLHTHDFKVPRLIHSIDRETRTFFQGKLIELQGYLDHDSTLEDHSFQEVSHQVFDFLGRYHRVSSLYSDTVRKPDYLPGTTLPMGESAKYFQGPLKYGLPRYIDAADSLERPLGSRMKKDLKKLARLLESIYEEYLRRQISWPELVCHNDFHGNNLLFNQGRIAGLVDFDFCRTGFYQVDLVEALHGSAVWQEAEDGFLGMGEAGEIRAEKAVRDLGRYYRHNPDFPRDGRFLIRFLMAKLIGLLWYPGLDLVPETHDKIEALRRLKLLLANLEELHTLDA